MTSPPSMKDWLAEDWGEKRPILEEMLAAAREGLARSKWKIGDPDDKLLWPIVGALTAHLGKELRVQDMLAPEADVRKQVAQELRDVAVRHPVGSARRAAFLEAAEVAEQRQR
ncbi:hypothetical protein [Streptomyces cinereoruber]|uniref:hypothetical protein n=1 Tax=Streptomyces cinereoruber TaxID=67260 RepID=UPI00363A52C5